MASTAAPRKLSGLQKEVFGLYRTILREAIKKDRVAIQEQAEASTTTWQSIPSLLSSRTTTSYYATTEFRKQAVVRRGDFKMIEFKLRHGHKQLKLLQMPGVKVVKGV
jgi:hypothetical protein